MQTSSRQNRRHKKIRFLVAKKGRVDTLPFFSLPTQAGETYVNSMNDNDAIWKPNVTVAAVIELDGRFLLVEEHTERGARYNQPAGHLEPDESLAAAAIRETLEESAYHFVPRALLGIYHYRYRPQNITYMRFAFTGEITGHEGE